MKDSRSNAPSVVVITGGRPTPLRGRYGRRLWRIRPTNRATTPDRPAPSAASMDASSRLAHDCRWHRVRCRIVGNGYRPRKPAGRRWLVLRARLSTLLLFVVAVLAVVVLFVTVIAAVVAVAHNDAYAGAAGFVFIMLVVALTVWMVVRAANDRRAAASRASGRGRTRPLFGLSDRTPATSAMSLPGQAERIHARPFRSEERKRIRQAPPKRQWAMGLVTVAGLDAPSHMWIQLDKFDPAVNSEVKTKVPGPFEWHSASQRWVLPLKWETCTGARAVADKFNATIKLTDPMPRLDCGGARTARRGAKAARNVGTNSAGHRRDGGQGI